MRGDGVVRAAIRVLTAMGVAMSWGVSGAESIASSSGGVRVEFDTELFALRYVGAPGGSNLVAPFHIPRRERGAGTDSLDPGGVTFHVVREGRVTRAGGPGDIIEQRSDRIVVCSAPLDDTGVRVRVECALANPDLTATVRAVVQTTSQEAHEVAISIRTALAPEVTLRLPKADATIRGVMPESMTDLMLVDAGDHWKVDPNPVAAERGVFGSVEADSDAMTIVGKQRWYRRVTEYPGSGGGATLPCLQYRRQGASRQRIVQWTSPPAAVDLWNAPCITETWRLEAAGD